MKYAKPQVFNCSSLNSFSRRHDLHVGWKRIVHKRIFQSHQEKSGSNKTSFEVFKFCASILLQVSTFSWRKTFLRQWAGGVMEGG